jgi:beta-glucosidase/6-phospho-beta-glucosidase/beta-galactosidase
MRQRPAAFLWGTSTASYQVEGGITNNDWHYFITSEVIRKRVLYELEYGGQNISYQAQECTTYRGRLDLI